MDAEVSTYTFLTMIIEEYVCFMSCEPIFLGQLFWCGTHGIYKKGRDRKSSDHNFSSRGYDRQSSEQNNRKLISLHNNGEDDKHAHGFADFKLRNGGLNQILKRQTSRFHYGSKVPAVTIAVFITMLEQNR
jgi:hypothetical protein